MSDSKRGLRDRLRVVEDPAAVAEHAARFIADAAREAVRAHGRFTLALTGGSSPLDTYAKLATPEYRDAIDWSKTHLFWGDERAVPADRAESNYGGAHKRFVANVPIPAGNVHRMQGERADLEAAARDYAVELRATCDRDGTDAPVLDLLLLGIGGDAHILSLHPGCPAIRGVDADVIALRDPPMNPALSRITFTPRVLDAARSVLVFAHTAAKAAPLKALLDGDDDPMKYPAQLLRRARGRVTILADRAAAG
jgi:6-phosphogluconolactonase